MFTSPSSSFQFYMMKQALRTEFGIGSGQNIYVLSHHLKKERTQLAFPRMLSHNGAAQQLHVKLLYKSTGDSILGGHTEQTQQTQKTQQTNTENPFTDAIASLLQQFLFCQ